MKKITDSFMFQQVMKNENIKNSIKSMIISNQKINMNSVEDQLNIINKRMKYPGKDKIIELLNDDIIVPIYNPTLGIPKYLNAFMKADGNRAVVVCDLTNFSRISMEGNSDITAKSLFALLQNAAVFNELTKNWNRYTTNVNIVKNGAMIYSKLFGKVLDKLYAIKIDDFKSDLVHFLLAKFFIVNMCDRIESDTVDEIAYYSCFNKSTYELIRIEANQLPDNIYDNIETFIRGLSTLNMKNLNIRVVVENFARMYGEATLLSIDYLPAFLGMIFGVAIQGAISKDYIIEGLCGKNIESLYIEFFKLSR